MNEPMMSVIRVMWRRWSGVVHRTPVLFLLAVGLLLPGCAGGEDAGSSPPAMAMESAADAGMDHSAHDMGDLTASGGDGYTESDVHFMQMMIGHHAQAVEMAALSESRDAGSAVLQLSERIDISQRDEILFMQEWLQKRDQPVPEERHLRVMQMPGLVSPENFERLTQARARDFDRLFLEFMIEHHLGAISMVDDLFDDPRSAQESDIFRFATDVAADQLDEIHVMERLLAGL